MMQVYKCKHCMVRFVVVPTVGNDFLPIEVSSITEAELKNGIPEAIYMRHKSHLKNCEGRKQDWPLIKSKFEPRPMRYING
jgi:hypothetical protein